MTDFDNQIITPDVWGPHGWKFIHYVTLGYPENPSQFQKERYKTFLLLLQDVLPCSLCANHYKETIKNNPLTDDILNSRNALIKWGINIHNIVNERNNKPVLKYNNAIEIIDTDINCKSNIIESTNTDIKKTYLINNNEKFGNLDEINNLNTKIVPNITTETNKLKSISNTTDNTTNNTTNNTSNNININIVYSLIGIFIVLIFIAVIYKKQ